MRKEEAENRATAAGEEAARIVTERMVAAVAGKKAESDVGKKDVTDVDAGVAAWAAATVFEAQPSEAVRIAQKSAANASWVKAKTEWISGQVCAYGTLGEYRPSCTKLQLCTIEAGKSA